MTLIKPKLIGLCMLLNLPLGSKDDMIASVSDVMLDIVTDTAYDMVEVIDNSNNVETIV